MLVLTFIRLLYSESDPALLKQFNLKSLAQDKYDYNTTVDSYTIKFNHLRSLTQTICDVPTCVVTKESSYNCECYGENSTVTWDEMPNNEGIYFKYTYKGFSVSYSSVVQYKCAKADKITAQEVYSPNMIITFETKFGCRLGGGIGWGWLFIIILFSSLALLFIIGIPINKFGRKKTGMEIVPFVYFWVGIPRMVMEGVKCIFSPCRRKQRGFDPLE
ncbi:hypothetical protein BLNAU_21031 [Blattamonas nauphoetae]|uniref:Uncharacterized protein n=1 Tax=Blattamonas nauphoetae TaxID=2049346 RepID=A0ABQ9WX21_9EUKA|nr:hypothetical protein BLNAU_21031 [Blattamonas nauphoetae]